MRIVRSFLAILPALAITLATAQSPAPLEPLGARVDIATTLGLDAARAQKVAGILAAARSRMHSVRQEMGEPADAAGRAALHAAFEAIAGETMQRLAAVLTAEELERLQSTLPPARFEAMRFKQV